MSGQLGRNKVRRKSQLIGKLLFGNRNVKHNNF